MTALLSLSGRMTLRERDVTQLLAHESLLETHALFAELHSPARGSWQRKATMEAGRLPRRRLPVTRQSASCLARSRHSPGSGGSSGSPTRSLPPKRPCSPCKASRTTESLGWYPIRNGRASASSAVPCRTTFISPVGIDDSPC